MNTGVFSFDALSHPGRREWFALAFMIGLTILFLPLVLWKVLVFGQGDAEVFFRGGWAVWTGYPLYRVTDHHGWTGHYPPTFALLMGLFANPPPGQPQPWWALPYPVAIAVWYLINAACLLLAVHVWANTLERHRPVDVRAGYLQRAWALRLGPLLALLPFLGDSLARGQTVPLLVFLVVLYLSLYVEKRVIAASFALSLAITVKEFPAMFAIFPMLRRDWRFIGWAAGWCVLLLVVVPVICLGPAMTVDLYHTLFTEHLAGIVSGQMSTKIASETSPGGFSSIGIGALVARIAAGAAFYTSPLPRWASALQLTFNAALALAIIVVGHGGFWNLRGAQPAIGHPLSVGGAILVAATPLMIAFAGPAYVPLAVPLLAVLFLEAWRRGGEETVTATMIVWPVAAWLSMIALETPWDWLKLLGPMTWVLLVLVPIGLSKLAEVSMKSDPIPERAAGSGKISV
jgi:Glycosyltransferase family 87